MEYRRWGVVTCLFLSQMGFCDSTDPVAASPVPTVSQGPVRRGVAQGACCRCRGEKDPAGNSVIELIRLGGSTCMEVCASAPLTFKVNEALQVDCPRTINSREAPGPRAQRAKIRKKPPSYDISEEYVDWLAPTATRKRQTPSGDENEEP